MAIRHYRDGEWKASFGVGLGVIVILWATGCGESSPPPPRLAVRPSMPLSIRPSEAPTRVFGSDEEIPTTYSTFDGAPGSVRVTLEIEGANPSAKAPVVAINDVVFSASGDGRISLAIKRPWPEHPNGRVTIACQSGGQESSADFEPELWFARPTAIVTFEALAGDSANPLAEGQEIILARYVARNLPHDIRMTLKAMFSRKPLPARTNAGIKPSR